MGTDRGDAVSGEVGAEEAQAWVTQLRSAVDELAQEVAERGSGDLDYRSAVRELEATRRDLRYAETVVILHARMAERASEDERAIENVRKAIEASRPKVTEEVPTHAERIAAAIERIATAVEAERAFELARAEIGAERTLLNRALSREASLRQELTALHALAEQRARQRDEARADLDRVRLAYARGEGHEELARELNALRETDSPRAREAEILSEIERLKRELDTVWASDRARNDADRLRRAMDPESLPPAERADDPPPWTVPADVRPVGLPSWAVPGFLRPVAPRGGPFARGPSEIPVSARRAPVAVLAPAQEVPAPLAPPTDEGER